MPGIDNKTGHEGRENFVKHFQLISTVLLVLLASCGGLASGAEEHADDAAIGNVYTEPDQIERIAERRAAALPVETLQFEDAINGLTFPNESVELAIALNREVLLIDTLTGEEQWRIKPCRTCSTVHITRSESDHEILMPSRSRKGGAAYDVDTGEQVRDLTGADFRTVLSPDQASQLSVAELQAVLIDPNSQSLIWESGVRKIGALGFAPNGASFVISADGDGEPRAGGKVMIYDPLSREIISRINYARGSFNHLAYAPDNSRLILASYKDRVLVWDLENQTPHCRFNSDDQGLGLRAFQLSPDGRLIATGGGSDRFGYARVWDADTCELRAEMTFKERVSALSFHPTKPLLAAGAWSGEVSLVNFANLTIID